MGREEAASGAAALFSHPEGMVRAGLEGQMGRLITAGGRPAKSALCMVGDFCFPAGAPDPELAARADRPILVPPTREWEGTFRAVFGERAVPFTRYAMETAAEFDRARLAGFAAAVPAGFVLTPIRPGHWPLLAARAWSRDLCGNFRGGEDFARRGLGFLILEEGVPAAGAASYAVWKGGIEIQIDTRSDLRRRGLALACGARLILECLDRGIAPHWDAHDLPSACLAEKLGFRLKGPYRALLLDTGPGDGPGAARE